MNSQPASKLFELMQDTIGMLCFARATHIAHWVMQTAHVPGAVAEFGCNAGRTATFLSALTNKQVWLYDSFKGLPRPCAHDPQNDPIFKEGAMTVSSREVLERFVRLSLPAPTIVGGFFEHLRPEDMPEAIAFAHLDGDFYSSIESSLRLAYPVLSPGGAIIVDDWQWEQLPGVTLAVNEFCETKGVQPETFYGPDGQECHQALIRKP